MNTTKLANETEELKHDKVSMDVGRLIQKGRQAKGWSQKELATKICEKPQVINEYESTAKQKFSKNHRLSTNTNQLPKISCHCQC